MEQQIDLSKSHEWEAKPEEAGVKIPVAVIAVLKYEITFLTPKKLSNFRCASYEHLGEGNYKFENVIIDTSEKKQTEEGELVLTKRRLTFHPWIFLSNVPFMVMPAPEGAAFPPAVPSAGENDT